MRARWNALSRQTQAVIGLAVAFVFLRTIIASLSGFGFHQGWNEGHYALLGSGFLDHPLVPRYGDRFVYSVPPLFPYTISVSFLLFGESALAARLPSILATGGLIFCTYELGREVFSDRSTAAVGAVILATLPYVQLYGGRAQTDIMMVFFITASITLIIKGYRQETGWLYWLASGAALFAAAVATKQPALGMAGIVFFWLLGNRSFNKKILKRTIILIAFSFICLIPLFIWLYLNYRLAPGPFIADWEHELFGRTSGFANVPLLTLIGLGLGMTPLVLIGSAAEAIADMRERTNQYRSSSSSEPGPSILFWWIILFGLFVFARGPHGHQYYAVVLAPPFALLAASGLQTIAAWIDCHVEYTQQTITTLLLVVLLLSTLGGTVVLFELSGEFSVASGGGTKVAVEVSNFTVKEIPEEATIFVPNGYSPPVKWYVRNDRSIESILPYQDSLPKQQLQQVLTNSSTPTYIVSPAPNWGEHPSVKKERIFITDEYNHTLFSWIGGYIETDSKFTYYLNDRKLVVSKLDERAI